ncbi:MAG: malonate transporter subunit MadL [Maribacter sp.]|uniref:malonate transporter subunit MadL n=1 Tax=Maribacter sp. TaxID=1897614 RepID=UPI003297A9C4
MKIYGVALLAFCFLLGKFIGNLLGALIGINGDVGGVGFGMLLLILGNLYLKRKGLLAPLTEKGILFWSSMYIPVVVAMSATQNVKAAISEGPIAIIVGVLVTVTGFFLVPLISKIGRKKQND